MSTDVIELTLAHSPDSDDTVMFWPLVGLRDDRGRALPGAEGEPAIDSTPFRFTTLADDVQALNRIAIEEARYDVTAISAHAYPSLKNRYAITASGGSFGEGVGPKLVVPERSRFVRPEDLRGRVVAVPGVNTSAFLALSLMIGPRSFEHRAMRFDRVMGAVLGGAVDAGVLIHEAQLTFDGQGLRAIADVGAWWTAKTGLPIPLGLNAIKRDLDERFGPGTVETVAELIRRSIQHARSNPEPSMKQLQLLSSQRPEWRDRQLVDRYLRMYVSKRTVDMGPEGRLAIARFLDEGYRAGMCPDPNPLTIVPDNSTPPSE